MTIVGEPNWWLPGWLARVLPHVSVESESDMEAGAAEIVDVVEPGDEEQEAAPARV